ncbi:MAG TPA: ABC transporter ATP-binding protein [Reyranella sp.]|nr:ABC transporter ATP-binding protein [Reyranella sp.]
MSVPILSARGIAKSFGGRGWLGGGGGTKRAVDEVDLEVNEGETLAIVGESGSGKSTLARILLGLTKPTAGVVSYDGRPVDAFGAADWAQFRKAVQPVFQDPASSLNPRMRVDTTLSHVLRHHKLATHDTMAAEIAGLLASVGLDAAQFRDRYPHQLSGGQQQRIAIARAMAVRPRLIIADEPLSSLDMSVQAQILDLLLSLKASRRLGLVLISHDLNVVDAIADRVIVMYLGRIVEAGPAQQVLGNPASDYTRSLLAAKLVAEPRLARARRTAMDGVSAPAPIS